MTLRHDQIDPRFAKKDGTVDPAPAPHATHSAERSTVAPSSDDLEADAREQAEEAKKAADAAKAELKTTEGSSAEAVSAQNADTKTETKTRRTQKATDK